ncbi:MAG TPA: NAD(P)H-quinone oxidoreductase [Gemmatimonadaceae bacterium]|nr:NAD(P)H-quinone oxidoreductase [Gemmatimonadaceae bacterium]
MRAVVITHAGGPEALEIRDVPRPEPGPGEVLVRVRATALNRADVLQREGRYPAPAGAPPDIPGLELAGEVVANGSGATRWPSGARVFGIVGGGAHAEYVTTSQDALAAIPDDMSWEEAGAVPEAFITAHDALITQAALAAGETVLIHAVASGVGLAAVQIARGWGAIPFGTTRTSGKLEAAREVGLEDGIAVGRDLDVLGPAVERWTGGRGIDVTLDLVGGPYFIASTKIAASRGRLMIVGSLGGGTSDFPLGLVLRKRLVIRGTVLRSRSLAEKVDATARFEREVVPLLATGRARPVIDSVYPLEQIADAHRRMESNESVGKVVILPP